MKHLLLYSLTGLILLTACNKPDQQEEISEVFESKSDVRSYGSKSYGRDVIEALFAKERDKDSELDELMLSVEKQFDQLNELEIEYAAYASNKSTFYESFELHLDEIQDSAMYKSSESTYEAMLRWEAMRMKDYKSILTDLAIERQLLKEQVENIKLRTACHKMREFLQKELRSKKMIDETLSSTKTTRETLQNWTIE